MLNATQGIANAGLKALLYEAIFALQTHNHCFSVNYPRIRNGNLFLFKIGAWEIEIWWRFWGIRFC